MTITFPLRRLSVAFMFATLSMGATAQNTDCNEAKNDTAQATCCSAPKLNIVQPTYPGGKEALIKFLSKNIHYPDLAETYDVEGSVKMTFVVGRDGKVKDIAAKDCKLDRFNTTKFSQETEVKQQQLKKQFSLLFAKEGARVIRKMPKWTPGTVDGKPADVKYTLPIRFVNPNK
ncbi:MAG: TonB-dependent receptor [Prevotella sp.]|nr:TonB-dependent receptor [Prevotella sp.]